MKNFLDVQNYHWRRRYIYMSVISFEECTKPVLVYILMSIFPRNIL